MSIPSTSQGNFRPEDQEPGIGKQEPKKKVEEGEGIALSDKATIDPRAPSEKTVSREAIPPSPQADEALGSEAAAAMVLSAKGKRTSPPFFLKDGIVTREVFASLIPASIIKAPRGSKEAWEGFDESTLDALIDAFENGEITAITMEDGTIVPKMVLTPFESSLYKSSEDLEKTKIISAAFEKYFAHSNLPPDSIMNIQKTVVEYVDFIGVDQSNIQKILENCVDTRDIITKEVREEKLLPFLKQISKDMQSIIDKDLAEVPILNRVSDDQLVITTTSSGGAHISIARVLSDALKKQKIPHAVLNESDLEVNDKCSKCIGIARKDIFNKISQQSGKMSYGKKLKKLDDLIGAFIPDQRMKETRKKVGESNMIMSTSHHPENVRLAAEKKARVSFQICDFGEIPDKLQKIAATVATYNLSGIVFYAPSSFSSLKIEDAEALPGGHEGVISRRQGVPQTFSEVDEERVDEELERDIEFNGSKKANEDIDNSLSVDRKQKDISKTLDNYSYFVRTFRYPVHEAFTNLIGDTIEEIHRVKAGFREEPYNVDFRPDAKLWALTMGSQGVGGILETYLDQIIEGSLESIKNNQGEAIDIAILTGGNKQMGDSLQRHFDQKMDALSEKETPEHISTLRTLLRLCPVPRIPLEKMAEIGKVSDAFLSKPGGGTAAEALIGEFPMVIHREKQHPWEFGNIEELRRKGAEEMLEGENFYDVAMRARTGRADRAAALQTRSADRAPDPFKEPEKCVEYSLDILWRIQQSRKVISEHLEKRPPNKMVLLLNKEASIRNKIAANTIRGKEPIEINAQRFKVMVECLEQSQPQDFKNHSELNQFKSEINKEFESFKEMKSWTRGEKKRFTQLLGNNISPEQAQILFPEDYQEFERLRNMPRS